MSTKETSKAYDEALAELIEVIEMHSIDELEKKGLHTLANTVKNFLIVDDLNEVNKIFEQINTILPMNRINAVGQAFIKGNLGKHCGIIDLLSVIANFEINKLIKVHDLICKLRSLLLDPKAIGQGILDVENRSHEEMAKRFEEVPETESSTASKPSVIFVMALRNEKRNNYYVWEYFLSKSRYEKTEYPEKRPIIFTWSCLKEHVENIHANLKDDTTIMAIEKYYGLNKRLTQDESGVMGRMIPKPNAWAVHDNAISEPLWLDENRAQEAIVRLAELLKE